VCVKKPGVELTISGGGMLLTVTYVRDLSVPSNGGKATGCLRVSEPFEVKEGYGKSLLNPGP
jgi:hypothetical protein